MSLKFGQAEQIVQLDEILTQLISHVWKYFFIVIYYSTFDLSVQPPYHIKNSNCYYVFALRNVEINGTYTLFLRVV